MVEFFPELLSRLKKELDLTEFVRKVRERIDTLADGALEEEKQGTLACRCPLCVAAKAYAMHMSTVGDPKKLGLSCLCHICISAKGGFPEREMPHAECPCPFCEAVRKYEARGPQVMVIDLSPPEDPEQMGDWVKEVLSALMMPKEFIDAKPLKAEVETGPKWKTRSAPPQKALPPKQQVEKQKQEANATSQETTDMPSEKSNKVVNNRETVNIGGKETPYFETKGSKIITPEGMHKLEAAEWLLKQHAEEQQMVGVNEEIRGFPLDAAVSLFKALNKHFGWTDTQAIPTWFGDIPPQLITVATGVHDSIQVPWGDIRMPGIEDGYIRWSGAAKPDGTLFLRLSGQVKKKDRETIAKIVRDAKEILAKESIYKGKAIRVKFPELDPDNGPDITNMPSFYDTSKVRPEEVVFAKPVEDQINVSLFTPIRHTEACRKNRIPLKRTVLFAGTYGVGKTLTAAVTAQEAEKHNWTFIMPDSAEDLKKAVEFAKQYEPAVIFVEDIDSVVKGERSVDMDSILNIVDGAESKGRELMIVLTTNHPDLINKAMLRPGRIDALIEVAPPDAYAAEKLIRVYARNLLSPTEDVSEAAALLSGHKPASIREVVERAKLAAIFHHGDEADHIDCNDLVTAVNIMKPHFALMEEKVVAEDTSLDALLKKMMREAVTASSDVPVNGTKKATEARA